MKITKLLPALLLVLGLAACTPSSPSSEPTSSTPTSSEVSSETSSEETSSEEPSSESSSLEEPSSEPSSEDTGSAEPSSETSNEEPSSSEEPSSEETSSDEPSSETSSEEPVLGWNTNELALIEEYAYGVDIPYYYIEGNEELFYDDQYGCLSLTGATVTDIEIEAYAELFIDADWTVVYNLEDDGYYEFEKTFETSEGARIITTDLYINYESDYSTSGDFWLDIYDIYFYEWPQEVIDLVTEYLTGSVIHVPEFDADLYYLETSYIDFGFAWIDCYTESVTACEDYADTLEFNGYEVELYEDSYYAYDSSNTLCLAFYYDAEYGALTIMFYPNENGGSELSDAEAIISEIAYNLFGDETAYDYDSDYDEYYTGAILDEFLEDEFIEAIEFVLDYLPTDLYLLDDPEEFTEYGETYGYVGLTNYDETVFVYLVSYFSTEDDSIVVEIAAYNY